MEKRTINVEYEAYSNILDLEEQDQKLIQKAIAIAKKSYAPYSNFPVGAAVHLDNDKIYTGNNQENMAYPSGTCAERSVLNYVHGNYPDNIIDTIAITAPNSKTEFPTPPCGFCRQVILEMEQNQKRNIRIILHKIGGVTFVFPSAASLLPLAFVEEALKK